MDRSRSTTSPSKAPIENPLHPGAIEESRGAPLPERGRQIRHAGRRLQHRLHHLPAHRALSLLDQEQSHERAAGARAFRGNSRGTGRRDGLARRRARQSHQRARPLYRQGDGDAPHQGHDDRWPQDLPDRHPHPLGLSRHRGGRRQDRADAGQHALARRHRPQRVHARVQGLPRETGESCEPRRPYASRRSRATPARCPAQARSARSASPN